VKSTVNDQDLEFLAGLTEPQRRCALMLTLVTNGDVTEAARAARELDPRDQVESRLSALFQGLSLAAVRELALGGGLSAEHRGRALGLAERLAGRAVQVADALVRHRRPPEQRIVVERVMVADGGQAMVGIVGGDGGDGGNEHQPHALAHAPEPTLQCEVEAGRATVPAAGDVQGPLPDARRRQGQRRA
jgi:hypothetical protein